MKMMRPVVLGHLKDPPVQFSYGDTDGGSPSLAQVIVHPVPGAKVPPVARDDVAPPPTANTSAVTVDVLKNDDDPLGSPDDLKVSWAPAGVTVHGADLTVKLQAEPREVPYQVTAPDGATATAVVCAGHAGDRDQAQAGRADHAQAKRLGHGKAQRRAA